MRKFMFDWRNYWLKKQEVLQIEYVSKKHLFCQNLLNFVFFNTIVFTEAFATEMKDNPSWYINAYNLFYVLIASQPFSIFCLLIHFLLIGSYLFDKCFKEIQL